MSIPFFIEFALLRFSPQRRSDHECNRHYFLRITFLYQHRLKMTEINNSSNEPDWNSNLAFRLLIPRVALCAILLNHRWTKKRWICREKFDSVCIWIPFNESNLPVANVHSYWNLLKYTFSFFFFFLLNAMPQSYTE